MTTKNVLKTVLAASCCLGAIVFASCDNDDNKKPASLKFSETTVNVNPGQSASVTVNNGTAPYKAVVSDEKIATVKVDSKTLTVNGVKEGVALVSVSDSLGLKGSITVNVKNTLLDVDKVRLTVGIGKEGVVTVKSGAAPYTATVEDASVATATVNGSAVTVKGLKAGTTKMVISDKDKKTATISVTVE